MMLKGVLQCGRFALDVDLKPTHLHFEMLCKEENKRKSRLLFQAINNNITIILKWNRSYL